ncbi:hypothetical protein TNIN_170791 [Trichonephila inaurata madagascariensis]|uniref:Uncharacterized protein n=1 Tax=Trichonephila inaurata madagascariensis TaxID=2747483 RepID=A0A8X6IQC4_9ARAC|nr:hypothetical protein TNIN_170791 [Trichonephila inaurata madagascariensis]
MNQREEHCILAENGFGNRTNRTEFHKQVQRDGPTAATLVANTYAVNNAKKKTTRTPSELKSEEIQRVGLVVVGIVQREQLTELKEKIKCHFTSPSAPWYNGW